MAETGVIEPVVFEDHFDGSSIDSTKWNIDTATGGKRWCSTSVEFAHSDPGNWQDVESEPCNGVTEVPPYGFLTVDGGLASFSGGLVRASPYIWAGPPSRLSPFPNSGDFILEVRMRYDSIRAHGAGVHVRFWENSDPIGNNPPGGNPDTSRFTELFNIWGDTSIGGVRASLLGQGAVVSQPLGFHEYRLTYVRGEYRLFIDGVLAAGPLSSNARPNTIYIGNPVFTFWGVDDWSDFSVDLVRVSIPVPVVLVHGICGDPGSFGQMRGLLTSAGLSLAEPFDYSALTGEFSRVPIEELAGIFSGHVRQVLQESGARQIDVVAHSMGGLIVRAWMANFTAGVAVPYEGQIRRLILVGAPHYGARRAALSRLAFIAGCSEQQAGQMRFGSAFVWDLHERWLYFQSNSSHAIPAGRLLFVAGTQSGSCGGAGCDDGLVEISSAVFPDSRDDQIRYVPYKHAATKKILPILQSALVNVTSNEHATYRIVEAFLKEGTVLAQCCGQGTIDYEPPHLRKQKPPKEQEGLLLVRFVDAADNQPIASQRAVLSFEPRAGGEKQRNVGAITQWAVKVGTYDVSVDTKLIYLCGAPRYALGFLPDLEIKVARPTVPPVMHLERRPPCP